jgi:hypothetical protein
MAQQANAPVSAYAAPDLNAQRVAMQRLASLVGEWAGEARITAPRAMIVHQTESVEWRLDGLALLIHGAGFSNADRTGDPVFRAMAVISYDDRRGVYEFRAYNAGRATTAEAQFLENGTLRWSISTPAVQIRYTIRFDAGAWREIGEMSRDNGQTWTQTFEMNLARTSSR